MIGVCLAALDDTTARSVSAFLESRHADHFALVAHDDAELVFIDLDQPGAAGAMAAIVDGQIIIGVGFAAEAELDGCRLYVQKPLTGAVVTDALAEAVTLIGVKSKPTERAATPGRHSHGRDVLRRRSVTTNWDTGAPKRTAPARDWGTDVATPRFDRAVFARADTLAAAASGPGTAGAVGEMLGHGRDIEHIEARDAGNLTDPEVLASVRYPSAHHLDGLVRRALAEHPGRPWEIRGDWGSFAYDPARDVLLLGAHDTTLRAGCHQLIEDAGVEVHPLRSVPDDPHLRAVPRDIALWNISVWCSRGRLPEGVDPFAPVTLRAWPDLARGVLTPSVLPIVALLTAGAQRPVDVPGKLGVSRSHVFVVLAAAHALGLLEGFDTAPELVTVPVAPTPHRGIVRRLLGRLGAS